MCLTPRGWDDPAADPIAYIRGLEQRIPEARLTAILSRTGRQSGRRLPADCVSWLVIAMALFTAVHTAVGNTSEARSQSQAMAPSRRLHRNSCRISSMSSSAKTVQKTTDSGRDQAAKTSSN
ncbi:transposase domain-containing protein [Tautonia plasticadhaerens]|uniref:Uncharacterized protein n=1 Tax=Tautonia plasticadhaerens TaxID=2527974 RepID=A0A518H6G0_9BACT|nr:transposase domain-containing protein [Tautonia plasticadhaerens]QDV36429.1 hypothetical protein ElP_43530 [Tautonia plasticadhaerens]